MKTSTGKSFLSYIPGYSTNAVIQLIIFNGVGYCLLSIAWAIVMIVYGSVQNFDMFFIPNIALSSLDHFKLHWWTILTYGLFHRSFWELLSNMLWLYSFGNIVQLLIGYKQVIPLYLYSLVCGGLFFILIQFLPASTTTNFLFLGPKAGLVGLAIAAITLSPKYRLYLTEYFSIPLYLLTGVFIVLMVISTAYNLPSLLLLIGGAVMGFCYIKLLNAGYRPGAWMYEMIERIDNSVTPKIGSRRIKLNPKRDEIFQKATYNKQNVTQKRIDEILDKINLKGYNSLSQEEKDLLIRIGKNK